MLAAVDRIWPKLFGGATFELHHEALGLPHSTWFGALNISVRNSSAWRSVMRKLLMAEKSKFTCLGEIRLFRAQLPYWPATVFANAAGFRYALALGSGRTAFEVRQLIRLLLGLNEVPAESHDVVSIGSPLCSVAIVLTCQPPAT